MNFKFNIGDYVASQAHSFLLESYLNYVWLIDKYLWLDYPFASSYFVGRITH